MRKIFLTILIVSFFYYVPKAEIIDIEPLTIDSYKFQYKGRTAYDWWTNLILNGKDENKYMIHILIRPGENCVYSVTLCPNELETVSFDVNKVIARKVFYWKDVVYEEKSNKVVLKNSDFKWIIKSDSFKFSIDSEKVQLKIEAESLKMPYRINDGKLVMSSPAPSEITGFYNFYSAEGYMKTDGDKTELEGWACFEHLFTADYFWKDAHLDWVPFFADEAYGLLFQAGEHREGFIYIYDENEYLEANNIEFKYEENIEILQQKLPLRMTINADTKTGNLILYCNTVGADRNELGLEIKGFFKYQNGKIINLENGVGWNETSGLKEM